jgi:hypothetical protein
MSYRLVADPGSRRQDVINLLASCAATSAEELSTEHRPKDNTPPP